MKRNRRKRRLLVFCFVFALIPLTAQKCTGDVPCGTGTTALALFLPLALPRLAARVARFAVLEADPPCDAGSGSGPATTLPGHHNRFPEGAQ